MVRTLGLYFSILRVHPQCGPKGKCFYCFIDISIELGNDDLTAVDHFLSHVSKERREIRELDSVWNLVLACETFDMSRLARAPLVEYWTSLNTRNNYLISSHHPLSEALIHQTGDTDAERHSFLRGLNGWRRRVCHRAVGPLNEIPG